MLNRLKYSFPGYIFDGSSVYGLVVWKLVFG